MRALAPAVPDQVSAGVANLKAVTFSGFAGEQQWVHIEIFEGSYGGRLHKDGLDSVDTLYANTRNNPIEDIESHVMRPGESLWILAARRYNVPVWLLRQYNPDLDFDRILAGTVVRFPHLKAIAAGNVVSAATSQVLADNPR